MTTSTKKIAIALASSSLIALIGSHEGLRTKAYLDPVGIPTICYGSIKDVQLGQKKTKEDCDKLLVVETTEHGKKVLELVNVPINQYQYNALTSFAYNVGVGNLKRSTLLKKLNRGDYEGAAQEFDKWVYAKGKKLNGLVARRAHEKRLFLTPVGDEQWQENQRQPPPSLPQSTQNNQASTS